MSDPDPSSAVVFEGDALAIRLPVFDGPFPLLLHLIRKEELDIFDIPIARLTAAYLRYLEAMRQLSIEPASEFLVMAATLMQLKSRLLVPRRDEEGSALDDEESDGDPREQLVTWLLEYKRYQDAAVTIATYDRLGRDVYVRSPGLDRPSDDDSEDDLASHRTFQLGEAFRRLIGRTTFQAPHDISVERVTVGERIAQIADLLARIRRTTYERLCADARHPEELITTFLALLEMSRLKLVRITQAGRLEPVYVETRVHDIGVLGEEAACNLSVDELDSS